MPKILKNVRLSEELISKIENTGDNNFTVNLEKILNEYFEGDKKRQKRIEEQKNELARLSSLKADKLIKLSEFTGKIDKILYDMKSVT